MAESMPNGELAPGEPRVLDIHPTREEAGGLLAFVNVELGGWIVRGIKLMQALATRGRTGGA